MNALGHFRFMVVEGSMTAVIFRDFLRRLITGMDRKVILVVDGHPVHKAKLMNNFVSSKADRLELVFLPPYSPELNPDELVCSHVKRRVSRKVIQTKDELKKAAGSALQRLPDIVSGFFHAPTCSYAKA
ncbi:transposase [Nitrosococcus oceani]|uniref:transposase n=1 Tax=Nitrosococcus oceani TaxID=1229 RepID=UPI0011BE7114|nr:transposase [Nitrosococcus oceani]